MTTLLSCADLCKSFGGLKALEGFTLSLRAGEVHGLIGPNGAGKTTCFNVLTGLYKPDRGEIALGGENLRGLKPDAIARLGVARTFQNIRLLGELSALDNVKLAAQIHAKTSLASTLLRTRAFRRAERATQELALEMLAFFGLQGRAHEQAKSLSYGDQRRLEIARALAAKPRVLLLDEPAAGMNPQEKIALASLLRRVRERFGAAMLLIEHDVRLVLGLCDRITVLDYGRPIAHGTPQEIRTNPAVIEAYLGSAHA